MSTPKGGGIHFLSSSTTFAFGALKDFADIMSYKSLLIDIVILMFYMDDTGCGLVQYMIYICIPVCLFDLYKINVSGDCLRIQLHVLKPSVAGWMPEFHSRS